jgi:hypothetical protein
VAHRSRPDQLVDEVLADDLAGVGPRLAGGSRPSLVSSWNERTQGESPKSA